MGGCPTRLHINAKELRDVVNNEQWDVLGSVLSLQRDDELAFGGDAILGSKKAGFLRSELNTYVDQAHDRIKLGNAMGNLSLTGITSSLTGALRAVSRGVSEFRNTVRNFAPIDADTLSKSVVDKILAIPKGNRPEPSTYLSSAYLDAHASMFKNGVARIQPSAPQGKIGRTETWVMPADIANEAIRHANGDPRLLEHLLGMDKGYLGNNPVVIKIPDPAGYRIPSGNEFAAYDEFWRPGGFTHPGRIPEAVINPVFPGQYTVQEILKRP